MRKLLSVREAGLLLDYHPEYVRELSRQGRLPGLKVGPRAWVYDREELEAWKERRDRTRQETV